MSENTINSETKFYHDGHYFFFFKGLQKNTEVKLWINALKNESGFANKGPLHMSPVDRGMARFPRWEKVKDPGDEFWRQIRETKQTWRNTKILTIAPIMIASVSLKAVSQQLNGMLMMWQCKTMPGPPEFIPPFIPVTGMKCSYGKISSPLTEISVFPSPPSHINTSKILQRI